jgi:hypothetical protein
MPRSAKGCVALIVLALLLPVAGCYTRSPDVTAEESAAQRKAAELYMLNNAEDRWGFRRPRRRDKRPDYRDGFYIHVAGATSCGGFLRKEQTTHVYAWVTQHSPTGPAVDVKILNAGFRYKQGLFAGTERAQGGSRVKEVEAHDTISGLSSDICQCVEVFASAKLEGRVFLRTYDQFCPEGVVPGRKPKSAVSAAQSPGSPRASTPAASSASTSSGA